MKKTYLLLLLAILCGSLRAYAVVHTITVQNFQFTPANITTVHVGDTIKWTWINGAHTTTSTAVPAGAASWNQAMSQSSQTFSYKVTKAGVYNYWCVPHQPSMAGSFTASAVSAVPGIADAEPAFALRGNVVNSEIKVDYNLANSTQISVRLYNLIGRLIRSYGDSRQGSGSFQETYPVGDLPKGLYLLAIIVDGRQTTRRVIVE
ncbi:MAG: plastocyanin/azurin family copper-binding protein [Saprospiraceae bacterium]